MNGKGKDSAVSDAPHGVARLLTFSARRPVTALVAAGVVLVLAAIGLTRLRASTSLEAMFPRGNPSADALIRVLDAFPAASEMVLLVSAPQDLPPEQATLKLQAFAARFESAVNASDEARTLTKGVIYRADPDFRRFAEKVLVPNGLFYLDGPSFAEARKRLTPEGMKTQIAQNEAMVSQPGPAASAAAKQFLKDPLRLHEFVLGRLGAQRQFKTWQNGETFLSPEGRSILIRVVGTQSSSDLDYCEKLMRVATSIADEANTEHFSLHFTGAYAAADFSHHAIRHDSIVSIFSSILLLQLLFLIVYRRPFRQFLLELSPVMIGLFVGFGLYGWTRGEVSPIAAVIGGILAGLGIDYSVLYLAAYFRHLKAGRSPREAVILTAQQTVGPMFAAWLTSAIGFIAIGWSSVTTLRDFSILGTMALACAFAAVVLILPAVLTLWDTRRLAQNDTPAARQLPFRFEVQPILNFIERRRVALIVGSSLVMVIAAGIALTRPGGLLPLESDLHVMHPQPNPALAAERTISQTFGAEPGSLIVHLKSDTPSHLLELSHEVERRLAQKDVRSAGVSGTFGLATLLPDPALAASRRGAISDAEIDKIIADFRAAIAESLFEPAPYEAYADFLKFALRQQNPPGIEALRAYPELWRSLLPKTAAQETPTEAITLVFVNRPTDQRESREAFVSAIRQSLDGVHGATLTGLPVISLDTEAAIRRDLPRLLGIAGLLVVVLLAVYYRSPTRMLLAITPVIFSLICLAAVARLTDQRLNLINLVALPLLIGIDVDYGIYLVSLADTRRRSGGNNPLAGPPLLMRLLASAQAVMVCATASSLGFGSLVTVSVPAVQSLGFVVAVGVVSCLIGTFALLAPILMCLDRRSKLGQGSEATKQSI